MEPGDERGEAPETGEVGADQVRVWKPWEEPATCFV